MATSKTDSKKRVVLPGAKPGEVYDILNETEGTYVLVRLERPSGSANLNAEAAKKAIRENPLEMQIDWERLRSMTRDP